MIRPRLAALGSFLVLASSAQAQDFRLNEIYINHSGLDEQEFIEIVGPPATLMAGLMVLGVEGEGTSAVIGELEFAYDLSSFLMPVDGYFVIGDSAVPTADLAPVSNDLIENGTQTFYLLEATDPSAVQALVGTSVALGGTTSIVPTLGTILDSVAVTTGECISTCIPTPADTTYDGAQVIGPDFMFTPAGIYRGEDYPNGWCTFDYLDFDVQFNVTMPSTPGFKNFLCAPSPPLDSTPGVSPFISLSGGGSQSWLIDFGPDFGGQLYWVGGSVSGTLPGFPLAPGVLMPLNFDPYLQSRIAKPLGGPLQFPVGFLGGAGTSAFSAFTIPAGVDPTLAGVTVHHSVVSFDAFNVASFASNAIPVFLVP